MTNKPILYYVNRSPPCRTVLMVAKAIGVDLELKLTLTAKGENRTPEFLKVSKVEIMFNILTNLTGNVDESTTYNSSIR